jgi:uncharacterized membrane protein YraQ (UPF0718 family)
MCGQSVSLMRDKIRRHKWAIFIIALAAIDIIWIAGIWIYFASSQERISLITPLITFNSILIAGMGIAYQVEATKEREFQLKIQQQRREEYTKILNLMKEGLHQELIKKAIKNSSEEPNETKINELRKLLDAQFAMMVYASAEFIDQYVSYRKAKTVSRCCGKRNGCNGGAYSGWRIDFTDKKRDWLWRPICSNSKTT